MSGKRARSDSDTDDEFTILDEAPSHLRRVKPVIEVVVLDSDDEDEEDECPSQPPRKAQRSHSVATVDMVPLNADVGPTTVEADEPVGGPIPKAEYLVPTVVEFLPGVCPKWVESLLNENLELLRGKTHVPGQDSIRRVLDIALEMEGGYPKEQVAEEAPAPVAVQLPAAADEGYRNGAYRANYRQGVNYVSIALDALRAHFDDMPVAHINTTFRESGALLTPTCLALLGDRAQPVPNKRYTPLKRTRNVGKSRVMPYDPSIPSTLPMDPQYDRGRQEALRERSFMDKVMEAEVERLEAEELRRQFEALDKVEKETKRQRAIENGDAAECKCCFTEEPLEDLVSCVEGHMFCRDCVRIHAETKLGEQNVSITCMDMSECKEPFPEATIARVLSTSSLALYHRLKQMKDVEAARIDGLESCPYCPFAVVIENPDEKLFYCLNKDCRKVTCRSCRRPNHIPKRCEEVEADYKLDQRHVVEEAMSNALMRKCPECSRPYVKEYGCNKIRCQYCHTISCYICQRAIPEGYAHFDQYPGQRRNAGRCVLWDKDEKRGDDERILQAREQAQQQVLAGQQEGLPRVNAKDVDVDYQLRPAEPTQPHPPAAVPIGRHIPHAGAQLFPAGFLGLHGMPHQPIYQQPVIPNLLPRMPVIQQAIVPAIQPVIPPINQRANLPAFAIQHRPLPPQPRAMHRQANVPPQPPARPHSRQQARALAQPPAYDPVRPLHDNRQAAQEWRAGAVDANADGLRAHPNGIERAERRRPLLDLLEERALLQAAQMQRVLDGTQQQAERILIPQAPPPYQQHDPRH